MLDRPAFGSLVGDELPQFQQLVMVILLILGADSRVQSYPHIFSVNFHKGLDCGTGWGATCLAFVFSRRLPGNLTGFFGTPLNYSKELVT